MIDLDDDFVKNEIEVESLLEESEILLIRNSGDKQIHIYMYIYRLIEICRTLAVLGSNGRGGKDRSVGKITCGDSSLVDYVTCSTELVVVLIVLKCYHCRR